MRSARSHSAFWRFGRIALITLAAAAMLASSEVGAEYVDQACLGRCSVDCGTICTGRGEAKNLCIGECRRDNTHCRTSCTRPGSPPPLGSTCVGDVCTCPPSQTACGDRCVNLTTNSTSCGACGVSCPSGSTCVAGACSCPSGQTLCGGSCVNLTTNSTSCGACGVACPSGASCVAGACLCPSGETSCSGSCVDLTSDPTHCGTCGATCSNPKEPRCCAGCWYSFGRAPFCW
jgi:hypothetical protein